MNYNSVLTRLYFLLIFADGNANEKEVVSSRYMVETEGMKPEDFNAEMRFLKLKNTAVLFDETMVAMKKLNRVQQVRIIAWMCVLANADGFMERNEWALIYRVYHKELSLPLNDIFTVQKELNKLVWDRIALNAKSN